MPSDQRVPPTTFLLWADMKPRGLRAPSNLTLNVFQGWGIHHLFGEPMQVSHHLYLFLLSCLNLPFPILKPLPLVLSQQALLKSLSPSLPGCEAQQKGGRCPSIPQTTFQYYSPNPSPWTPRRWKEQPVPEK